MSTLAIILIALGALLLLLFLGGLFVRSRRDAALKDRYAQDVAEADQALERARAEDKGWDRALLEEATRKALAEARPGSTYPEIVLVLVDDRPGMAEDQAHLMASGEDGEARVVLTRHETGEWAVDRVE
jgi:hypothetical protein